MLGFVCEADYKLVAKAMRHRVTAIKRQREKQRHLLEEESNPTSQPPELPNQKALAITSISAADTMTNQVCLKLFPCKQGRKVTAPRAGTIHKPVQIFLLTTAGADHHVGTWPRLDAGPALSNSDVINAVIKQSAGFWDQQCLQQD